MELINENKELINNLTLSDNFNQRQVIIDKEFEESATPVFIAMLALSCTTFIAAFIQVNFF